MTTHGGYRPGSGHKPGVPNPTAGRLPQSKRLRVGDTFAVNRTYPDGHRLIEVWTVEAVDRTSIRLVRIDENGKNERMNFVH